MKIVRDKGRREITGIPRRTWDRLESAGRAPKRVKLTDRDVGWVEDELLDWARERVAERDAAPARAAVAAAM